MHGQIKALAICIVTFAVSAAAQSGTSVTNSNDGNSGTPTTASGTLAIPVYTGTATLGNSVITQLNGNVGIGTTLPNAFLDVASQKPATDGIRLSGLEFNWGCSALGNQPPQ